MYFYFISPLAQQSVKKCVSIKYFRFIFFNKFIINKKLLFNSATLLNLYGLIFKYYITDDLFPAEVAGLSSVVYSSENGIVLKASGYNEKLYLVIEHFTRAIKEFLNTVTPHMFETFKSKLSKDLYNAFIKPKALNK